MLVTGIGEGISPGKTDAKDEDRDGDDQPCQGSGNPDIHQNPFIAGSFLHINECTHRTEEGAREGDEIWK